MVIEKECLVTGKSVYEHVRDNNEDNRDGNSASYYDATTTFEEDFGYDGNPDNNIDNFARSLNDLNQDPDSTLAITTLAHPSNITAYMAQNKQGKKTSFINPEVIKDDPTLALDVLNTETLIISDQQFYPTAREGIARSAVKNIVILPLTHGIENEEEFITDIREHKGGIIKFMPSSLILKSLRQGYRGIKKADLIPGVDYYNYDEFLEAKKGDKTPVLNNPRPDEATLYLHTSGTTGEPKIVPKSDDQFALAHNAYMSLMRGYVDKDSINGNCYPLFPTTMMQSVLTTWAMGAEQVMNPLAAFNGRFAQNIYDHKVTITTANTQAYRSFLTTNLPAGSMLYFNAPIGGGEYMELLAAQEINERGRELGWPNRMILGYGASEMHPGTHLMVIPFVDYDPKKANVVGKGIGTVETRIMGLDGKELPRGERGLVEIKPDSKTFPYLGREEEYAEKWTDDGFYKTDDFGSMDENDWLHVNGRNKDKFVGRDGEEYFLFDTKCVINENSNSLRVIPVKLDYPVEGKEGGVVAYIQMKPDQKKEMESTLRDISAQAELGLEPAAQPLAYRFVDSFPTEGSTKTDLKILGKQREEFYAVEDGEVVKVSFGDDGEIVKKPASKIKVSKKL